VEFAIVLPVLMTIVLGCVDFGRFAYTYIAVTNAARAGAWVGSTRPYTAGTQADWEAGIRTAVADELQGLAPTFDPAKLTVATPVVSLDSQYMPKVRVEVTYVFNTLVSWPAMPGPAINLSRAVEMRIIR
jgi:Flp pilus assembly protein TadG